LAYSTGTARAGLQAPERNAVFAQHPAALDQAPAGGPERGVDVLGAGFGFVHDAVRLP
jgi:hypothetical protein